MGHHWAQTQAHPDGQDFSTTFQVVGNEGLTAPIPEPTTRKRLLRIWET